MASTTVGEQFMEAKTKEDSVKIRSLLADDVVLLGTSLKERASGKDTVGHLFARGSPRISDFKAMPLTKKGDANLVYYTGLYTQNVAPSAKHKKGGIDAGSYLLIANKDSKNDWKISYIHLGTAPFQSNKQRPINTLAQRRLVTELPAAFFASTISVLIPTPSPGPKRAV